MEPHPWKLGDPCFIADVESGRIRVMPATVIRLSGLPAPQATAMALNASSLGRMSEEGTAFPSQKTARAHAREALRKRTSWLAARLTRIPVDGNRPTFEIPESLPEIGTVVYVLDAETAEVLEVVVGFSGLEDGQFQAGYDASPGNPETCYIQIREWWLDKERALWGARNRYYKEFGFVSKEEVARRADAGIEKIWAGAATRLQDPEWNRRHNEAMVVFFAGLKNKTPVAAG